ncbi:TRAP transporter small permease [Pseudolysobacter antarcticus]|uniref:TRAP transporter small permease protein n=1 Tax=Pseudolysobacter antarcticus TaxID=2511995 RepID=A0A411HG08_9GAMM|nr:TRAP transporter small permease [Pseudolysobacter antarcticus]QBB69409.1 TRAP transporter small permease [Pseudolysobacter antarcticus]
MLTTAPSLPTSGLLASLSDLAILIAGAALIGMAGVEAWQVFARYVLNNSPGWTEPVALLLLTTAMSLGAACSVRSASHFGFFILVQSSPPALRRFLQGLANTIVAAVGLMLAWWSGTLFIDGWSVPMAGAVLPQSANFLPMATGGLLIALFALERIFAPAALPIIEGA